MSTCLIKYLDKKEDERLRGEMLEGENYYSFNPQRSSYLSRGFYAEQLKVWMSYFSKEQILILKSEDMFNDPPTIFRRVTEFLDLPHWEQIRYERPGYHGYPKMDATTRKRLIDYFKPHNKKLYEYLNINLDWDR